MDYEDVFEEFTEEKVGFVADSSHADRFIPRVNITKKKSLNGRMSIESSHRPFDAEDMSRVLDFEDAAEPPPDGAVRYCEDGGTEGLRFPVRHVCLRGAFLFYFDVQDVDDEAGLFTTNYRAPPLGVVPLEGVLVEFPPGGRRFFRDHAHHDDARNGYELVIHHDTDDPMAETTRPPIFLVVKSMGQREAFSKALQSRAEKSQDTLLRASTGGVPSLREERLSAKSAPKRGALRSRLAKEGAKRRSSGLDEDEDKEVEKAKKEFGVTEFDEVEWLNNFFAKNNDFDAPARCRELEAWQTSIKNGLNNAVKDQYVYFVDASREMTVMGKEVNMLKEKVEKQNELIKDLKEIDYSAAFGFDGFDSDDDELEPGQIRPGRKARARRSALDSVDDDESSLSSEDESSGKAGRRRKSKDKLNITSETSQSEDVVEVPAWLEDVSEEISAFIKECRYTDATDLLFKARNEVAEIVSQNERLTGDRLSKKQHATLNEIGRSLDKLTEWMSNRLAESLRRKNEALKQAGKRERSDPLSVMAPMVSPCCLDDDAIPLHLLVKLGKTQEAATAYAARRSLLLMESLHERPISGTGNVDIVIYSAQLSQSFFSCLASAVEGFLDLFLANSDTSSDADHPKDEDSSMLSGATRNVPPGALASVVLWCDSELSKFSSAFGGTRILGNLALSPPPRANPQNKPRMVGFEDEGLDAGEKERLNAIEVAAQCVDQAFLYASENLDSIGLPLTPRLAEYIRSRLKGCEAEVAGRLDTRWRHVTIDWEIESTMEEDIPMDERR